MAAKTPGKSILKQRKPQNPTPEQQAQTEKDSRNLSLALSHANKLELQKKIELQIVKNIETLLDLPTTAPPNPSDARTFTTLIYPFQPSDYSALIEERRINGTCGYALCRKPPRAATLGVSASWKLKGKGAGDFCSTACVKKALYVRAQLSEVPAWERVEGQQARVVLPEGERLGEDGGGVRGVEVNGRESGKRRVANGRELAAERGEEATSFKPRQVMMDSIVEKSRSKTAAPPAFPAGSRETPHNAIEGYQSKFPRRRSADEDDESDDEDDSNGGGGADHTSEIRTEDDGAFDEEEEAAWREMEANMHHLNTSHDR